MAGLLIGELARRTGLSAPTIRYYEDIGLLKPAPRSSAGYRRYSEATVEELQFVKKAQTLGFSLDEIREILSLSRAGRLPCSRVLTLARGQLAAVEQRIDELVRLRDRLASELAKWNDGAVADCRGLCQIIAGAEPLSGGTKPESTGLGANLRSDSVRRQRRI